MMRNLVIKQGAVNYKGGKCQKCGYNNCLAALEFHHRNPKTKDNLGTGNRHSFSGRDWSKIKRELDKCDLLCANCHREIHNDTSR
jgi:5-methylcytosine-specific restriction endonuclease McrA